jgi:hypothetical protein
MSDELKRQLRERAAIHKQLQSRGQRAEPWPALFSRAHDRIEKLEAKLITAEQRGYANAMEAERKLHEGRIEELKGKLAKAVEALEYYAAPPPPPDVDDSLLARAALAELKGEDRG